MPLDTTCSNDFLLPGSGSYHGKITRTLTKVEGDNANVISKMNEIPTVALFDLRFKDSLPPIVTSKLRGSADGEEEEWVTSTHYERSV